MANTTLRFMIAELTATCDSLCYNDGSKVFIDKNTIEVIKDLIRYLRRDDDTHSVRRYLGQTKLLQKDLIKIFIDYSDKTELWNVLLRLLINLTSPALMVYNEELPTDKITRSYYLQILSHLQDYKSSMTNETLWKVVQKKLEDLLQIESTERGEENEMMLERILTLIRNVLRVPANDSENRTDNDTNVHDELLFALHLSGISDLLIYMASTNAEQQYHMQILEIIAFMLQGQNPSRLAKVEKERSEVEKQADEAKLLLMRQSEQTEKMGKMKKYAGSRHSRFGGTFVVQNMKAIGDNEMLCHKPYQKIEDLDFSVTKQKSKKRRNRNVEVVESGGERVSVLSVRLFLKTFCVEFLNGAYNPVMRYARSCITAGTGSNADASHYLWALRFFMNFNRNYNFRVKYVSETISTEVFHLVQTQIEHHYDMMQTDKKKLAYWATRLHLGVNAYQELLYTLIEMDRSTDKEVKNSNRVIMNNIFYVPEYRDTILSQLLNYNELTMSRNYLVDLVTTAHIFLKMLKNFCDKERHVVVRKLKRKKPKKKSKSSGQRASAAAVAPRSLEDRWDELGADVSAVLQHNAIPEVAPFDATIDTPIDEQKGDAMKRIQKLLRCKEYEQAIGILRSAREVWPENDSFGKANMPAEEEFLVLREIFFADLGVPDETPADSNQTQNNDANQIEKLLNYDDEESEDEEDEEAEQPRFEETTFQFMDFLQRFVNVRIVRNLTILFQQFETNSIEVNHYVLKMYHRIALECKMPAMLYQASIFRVFQKIFRSENPAHTELVKFARYIFGSFAKVAMRNPKAYMELLFWKSTKEANEMTEGYDSEQHPANKKASRNAWSDAEEDELRVLFMEHQTNKYSQDLIDYLQEHLINQDRTRRGIIKKLKEMCLIVNSKSTRAEVQKRLPKEWSHEEIDQLTELWDQVKDEDDPVGLIYDSLRIKRSKPKIKEKLLELHLAEDAKQLRKKRSKKSDGPKSSWEQRSASEDEEDEEESGSDSEDDQAPTGSSQNKKTKKKKKKSETKRKSQQPTIVYTDAQLSGLLKDVIEKGMQEALQWLKESLEESLEDRDEENMQGQALVPLTAEVSEAIDSPNFQRLLRAIGIHSPDLEEAYWRIPATMLEATIKKRCDLIDAALRGEFVEEVVEDKRAGSESEDDDGFFDRLRNYAKRNESEGAASTSSKKSGAGKSGSQDAIENSGSPASDKENHDTENENVSSAASQGEKKKQEKTKDKRKLDAKRIQAILDSSDSESEAEKLSSKDNLESEDVQNKSRMLIDSDTENEAESLMQTEAQSQINSTKERAKSSRIRKVLDSDSEEETEKVSQNAEVPSDSKRNISESDTEAPALKKRRVLDSDEEDDATPEADKSLDKKQRRLLSDDED